MAGYPLAEPPAAMPADRPAALGEPPPRPISRRRIFWSNPIVLVAMLGGHALLCLACLGGWSEIVSEWPLAMHDHPMHFHNAVVTRSFLNQTRTTAGYDPYFMAGYAKSIISDPSGTLIDVWVALFGGDNPARAYKLLVFAVMACAALARRGDGPDLGR